jgi:hypothetical protein
MSRRQRIYRSNLGSGLIDLGIAVFILTIIGLVAANCYVLHLAMDYNDHACCEAVKFAGKAAIQGKDEVTVVRSAQLGLTQIGQGGFLIDHPQFTLFKDDKVLDTRVLRCQTQCIVKLPAAFLIFGDPEAERTGKMTLTSTYVLKLTQKTGAKPKEGGKTGDSAKEGGGKSKQDTAKPDSEDGTKPSGGSKTGS